MLNTVRSRIAVAACFVLLLTVRASHSQVLYGSLVGNVTDTSEAGIVGATVHITNMETNESRETQTRGTGVFSFPSIAAGAYTVEVRMNGFQTATQRDMVVRSATVVRADFMMQVGAVNQSVEVSAAAAELQTDGSDVHQEIGSKALQDIPLPPGRNFQNLLITVPGISPPVNANSVSANPARSLAYMANGATRSGNVMAIDGATVESTWIQEVAAYVPSLEAIEVVNVVSNSYDASQGFTGGAAVNVQVKSGTNQMHGSAFWYNFNNGMIARPFFLPVGSANPKSILNNGGATIGGPIRKNKLFYFGSYDGNFTRQNASGYYTVPTTAIKSGDMSADPTSIYDPASGTSTGTGRTPFPGNIIPQASISPIAAQIAGLTPLPNLPGNLLANNYFADGPYKQNRDTTDAKVTYNATDKLNLGVRFGWLHYYMDDPPAFGAIGGPQLGSTGGAEGTGIGNVFSDTVTANYVMTPKLVFDGYFGYTLQDSNQVPPGLGQNVGTDVLHIPGTDGSNGAGGGWPAFSVSSYTALGNQSTVPFYFHNSNYQYTANGNWTNGAHTVRFGVNLLKKDLNMFQELNQASGSFSFSSGITGLNGGPAQNQYNSYAAFLLGDASSIAKGEENGNNLSTERFYSLYAQDKWQTSHNLTLSYGLRWEYMAPPVGDMQQYNPTNNTMVICGSKANPSSDCGTSFSKKLFAPRVGVAYRPREGFVIRAGAGITYDPFFIGQQILRVYPNQISYSVSGPNSYTPITTLSQGIPALVFPDTSSGVLPMPSGVSLNSLGSTYTRSYIESWNLMLQKQLKYGFVAQLGYVGTRQVHQQYEINVNNGNIPGAGTAGELLNQEFGRTSTTNFFEPYGHAHYDAFEATLNRRFRGGYQIGASYSFSKAIMLCCADKEDAGPSIAIPGYDRLNRAVAPYDRTQVFTFSGIAELPFGRAKQWLNHNGVLTALVSGWQVNGLFNAYTGLSFTVSASTTSLNAPGNSQTADQIKPNVATLGGVGPGQSWFDPLAFAPVTQVRFGTSGFDTLRGPGQVNVDAALFRTFRFNERIHAQFRAQAFNAANTPHFANPGSSVNSLVLNPNGTINNLGGFTVITSTTGNGREGIDQRVFELALRVSF
ncbi:MAG TPA: TonB-dependent receptor [Bryobacteraceae bacterium]|nr:TonB-dependent receptor [Bryobacteraceae bacterium]